ncbi:hypothetical protein V8E36_002599 [Tilletia maclaganii]
MSSITFPTFESAYSDLCRQEPDASHNAPQPSIDSHDQPASEDNDDWKLPPASPACLTMLDPSIRHAYSLAYAHAKAAWQAGTAPDWTGTLVTESFSNVPTSLSDRMKAQFDAFFCTSELVRQANSVQPPSAPDKMLPPSAPDKNSLGIPDATAIGSASSGLSTAAVSTVRGISSNSNPTLTAAARDSVRGIRTGIHTLWTYCGLYRWLPGGLVEENRLTFDQIALLAKDDERFPGLRERWVCRKCNTLRHEQVGVTTNLTRHLKKCPANFEHA